LAWLHLLVSTDWSGDIESLVEIGQSGGNGD